MTCRGTYSRANAFLRCDDLDMPKWVRWIRRNPKDEDQWADDSFGVLNQGHTELHVVTLLLPCLSAGARVLALPRQRPSLLSIQTSKLPTKETSRSTFEKVLMTRTWSVIGPIATHGHKYVNACLLAS